MASVWDFFTFLWDSAMGFLNTRIDIMGLDFTLWEFALCSTLLLLICHAVFSGSE